MITHRKDFSVPQFQSHSKLLKTSTANSFHSYVPVNVDYTEHGGRTTRTLELGNRSAASCKLDHLKPDNEAHSVEKVAWTLQRQQREKHAMLGKQPTSPSHQQVPPMTGAVPLWIQLSKSFCKNLSLVFYSWIDLPVTFDTVGIFMAALEFNLSDLLLSWVNPSYLQKWASFNWKRSQRSHSAGKWSMLGIVLKGISKKRKAKKRKTML